MSSQSVVVTGGTQGLGFGYVREFLRRGHRVVLSGRDAGRVAEAVARLAPEAAAHGASVAGQVCDAASMEQTQALWDCAVACHGRVDIWLHNAGYARTGQKFLDNTATEIETMVRGNVIGSINAANVAIAGMTAQGGGKLFLTLGGGGATGRVVPGMTAYSTTKRAVKYLAGALVKERREKRDERVLVGTISPGVNVTEGMLREMRALPSAQRARSFEQLNFIGEHVETTTPWIVERVLAASKQGEDITWLTGGRMLGRVMGKLLGRKRDIVSRYRIED